MSECSLSRLVEMTWLFVLARLIFIITTTVVFAFSLVSVWRLRSKKTLLLALGFGLFFVHGLLSIPEIFYNTYNIDFTESIHLLIDAIAVLFILMGILKD